MTETQCFLVVAEDFRLASARFQAMRQDKAPQSWRFDESCKMPSPRNRKNNSLIWICETRHLNCIRFFQVLDQETKSIFAIVAQQTVRTAHCLQNQKLDCLHARYVQEKQVIIERFSTTKFVVLFRKMAHATKLVTNIRVKCRESSSFYDQIFRCFFRSFSFWRGV